MSGAGDGVLATLTFFFLATVVFLAGTAMGSWWVSSGYRDCVMAGATMERCVYVYVSRTTAGTKP